MSNAIRMIGGPMDGQSIGPWPAYPDHVIFEFDCARDPRWICLLSPQLSLMGADKLIAEYGFDRDWMAYSFAGWTVRRIPPVPVRRP
jgi:hypothetical protein